jgi:predicted  nucleic acid-binding Zn-ribbon protein
MQMPPAKRSTTKRAPRRPRALTRLEKSIDAAESALKDLRGELGSAGRDLLKDLDKTLKDSRKNLRSLSSTVAKDIQKIQKAATKPAARRRPGTRKTKKTASKKSSSKRR